jgi:beta-glucanase (GH16 family)
VRLTWADEFTGPLGSAPDATKWGASTWTPSADLQAYTADPANVFLDGTAEGHLVLKMIRQVSGTKQYTSARIMSRNGTGRPLVSPGSLVAARIKMPTGAGAWPAFWLVGDDNLAESAWPRCGEIDVVEATTAPGLAGQAHQGTHSPNVTSPSADVAVGVTPTVGDWGSAFHVYSCLWLPDEVRFFVDERRTGVVTRDQVNAAGGVWQLDHRALSVVLNVAVGGWGGGTPDPAIAEQSMLVDWMRVYG